MSDSREVRVFLSSTFRDMHAERDYLSKIIFPQLRKLCESRGVAWREVDLRWGITDEQSAEGEVLPICLAEIERCRPYFIGLLGERYGWVPDSIDMELLKDQPWLKEHLDRSVTELEIIHGVLDDPTIGHRALFYFRDPTYAESVSTDVQSDFLESDPVAKQKLDNLKERIRESRLPLHEDYSDAQTLGKEILVDLTTLINETYPEKSAPDPIDREAAEHEAFAKSRASVYIPRTAYYEQLDAHVAGEGKPLVILGESGVGKSALLANWAMGYRKNHPDAHLLMHFIGSSPGSSDWASMIRRILSELKRTFDIEEDIPDTPEALRDSLYNWLSMAGARGGLILILDALNQLDDRDAAPDLGWLPQNIPPGVHLIVSTLAGRSLDALQRCEWPTMEVKSLEADERRTLISDYLHTLYSKSLSKERVELIAQADQARNPLFIRAMLEELRLFGDHEKLDERIGYYLEAQDIPALYQRILQRYEEDYEDKNKDPEKENGPGFVRSAFTTLWAARRGLSESELLDILGENSNDPKNAQPLPHAYWSPLHLAAEQSLVNHSGLITFAHDYFKQAVGNTYAKDETKQKEAHITIANYFEPRELDERKVDELPWQFAQAKHWSELVNIFTNADFLVSAWNADKLEVRRRWAEILVSSSFRLNSYETVLYGQSIRMDFVEFLSRLLRDLGELESAEKVSAQMVEWRRQEDDPKVMPAVLLTHANILSELGNYDQALCEIRESIEIFRDQEETVGLQVALGNLAVLLGEIGRDKEALSCIVEQEKLCRQAIGQVGLGHVLTYKSKALNKIGKQEKAAQVLTEAEAFCRKKGLSDLLQSVIGNQAEHYLHRGELKKALKLNEEKETICRKLGYNLGLCFALDQQGRILLEQNRPIDAMKKHRDEEELCRTMGFREGLQACLRAQAMVCLVIGELNLALQFLGRCENVCVELGVDSELLQALKVRERILKQLGNKEKLFELYVRQEEIARRMGNMNELQLCLGNFALFYRSNGDIQKAIELHKEEVAICRDLDQPRTLQSAIGNMALALQEMGMLELASKLLGEQEEICRQHRLDDGLAYCLGNKARLLFQNLNQPEQALSVVGEAIELAEKQKMTAMIQNLKQLVSVIDEQVSKLLLNTDQFDEAESMYRRALEIDEASYGPNHPSVSKSLTKLATLLQDTNRYDEAESMYRRALEIDEASYGPNHPDVALSLNNLALLFKITNRYTEAEPMYRRALEINETSYGPNNPNIADSLNNLGNLLRATNRSSEAESLFRRALKIDESSFGIDHPKVAGGLNNLANLLYSTNEFEEAEQLSRQHIEIFLKITRQTGHVYQHLPSALKNYLTILKATGLSDYDAHEKVKSLLGKYGISLG